MRRVKHVALVTGQPGLRLRAQTWLADLLAISDGLVFETGQEALDFAAQRPLDAVFVACEAPDMSGASLVGELRQRHRIAAIGFSEAPTQCAYDLMRAGAFAYALIGPQGEGLSEALATLHRQWRGFTLVVADTATGKVYTITRRQFEVLRLIGQGQTNAEIAYALGIREVTVELHATALYRALGLFSRYQAGLWAKERGLDR